MAKGMVKVPATMKQRNAIQNRILIDRQIIIASFAETENEKNKQKPVQWIEKEILFYANRINKCVWKFVHIRQCSMLISAYIVFTISHFLYA